MKHSSYKYIPSSLYRVQFSDYCNFKLIREAIPYLKQLGVEGLYFSPYFLSASKHGYDVIDPNIINSELGSEKEFHKLCLSLLEHKMFHIMDLVPNHMSIKGKNRWWNDVLAYGIDSTYASYFDIDWNPPNPDLKHKILLPILRASYGEVLENQELKLIWNEDGFWICYQDYQLPVSVESYPLILEYQLQDFKKLFPLHNAFSNQYLELCKECRLLPQGKEERKLSKIALCQKLQMLYQRSAKIRQFISKRLEMFNGKKKRQKSFDALDRLLAVQHYRLSHWLTAAHEVNYRRFFIINDLAALRMEDPKVFESYHRLALELLSEKKVQGIRVDHPDGLYDPKAYLEKIKEKTPYVFIEKILSPQETLPSIFSVGGTVGYDFLRVLGGLFIAPENEKAFSSIYAKFTGEEKDFSTIMYEKKKFFVRSYMSSEISYLARHLENILQKNRYLRDFTQADLAAALEEIVAFFPVYRTYIGEDDKQLSKADARYLSYAIKQAKKQGGLIDPAIFDFLKKLFFLRIEDPDHAFRSFILKFQQITAPAMAKGLEDTAYYTYNRFLALNEVGGDPSRFGVSVAEFHAHNLKLQKNWPYGLLAFSTHDSKRSEDVRMRLSVLSEIPHEWKRKVREWAQINRKAKKNHRGILYPDANFEYLIYQTLLGIWPLEITSHKKYAFFCRRVGDCLLKSMREAKEHTNWDHPNLAYESKVKAFVDRLLMTKKENPFLRSFLPFQKKIAESGLQNSLSALVLRLGSCGVFDLYQGCEGWNFSLMDPDNRRKVSFSHHKRLLLSLMKETNNKKLSDVLSLWYKNPKNGKLKLYLTWKGLQLRQRYKSLFLEAEYIPLTVKGPHSDSIVAYMRKKKGRWLIFAAKRFFLSQQKQSKKNQCMLILPKQISIQNNIKDLITGESIPISSSNQIRAADAFAHLPFAILAEGNENI
jgi:(1->4)-alpha-D-glucan 1-alpha-D-glucosylmutase